MNQVLFGIVWLLLLHYVNSLHFIDLINWTITNVENTNFVCFCKNKEEKHKMKILVIIYVRREAWGACFLFLVCWNLCVITSKEIWSDTEQLGSESNIRYGQCLTNSEWPCTIVRENKYWNKHNCTRMVGSAV